MSMKFILTQIRRVFFAGTVALVLALMAKVDVVKLAFQFSGTKSIVGLFLLFNPILYFLFVIVCCIYIRKYGQFASVHKSQSFFVSVLRCIGYDLICPFKNLKGLFFALFGKNKGIPENIFRATKRSSLLLFIWMFFIIILYLWILNQIL